MITLLIVLFSLAGRRTFYWSAWQVQKTDEHDFFPYELRMPVRSCACADCLLRFSLHAHSSVLSLGPNPASACPCPHRLACLYRALGAV